MDETLREFDAKFQTRPSLSGVTYWRDVMPEYVDRLDGLLQWGMRVPVNKRGSYLDAIAIKWGMDVDEMFYLGDKDVTPPYPGLLTDQKFADDSGNQSLSLPCKWLIAVGKKQFVYNKEKLLFRIRWPKLVEDKGGFSYIGGIAPLALKGTSDA
jgi:hypothetical protein